MRCSLFLILCACSNSLTMELLTSTTEPEGAVLISVVNDSVVPARWSPCDEAWFIETENGRERDPTRRACNLDYGFPFGASELTIAAPEREGTFFVELRIVRQTTFVSMELGPIVVAK